MADNSLMRNLQRGTVYSLSCSSVNPYDAADPIISISALLTLSSRGRSSGSWLAYRAPPATREAVGSSAYDEIPK